MPRAKPRKKPTTAARRIAAANALRAQAVPMGQANPRTSARGTAGKALPDSLIRALAEQLSSSGAYGLTPGDLPVVLDAVYSGRGPITLPVFQARVRGAVAAIHVRDQHAARDTTAMIENLRAQRMGREHQTAETDRVLAALANVSNEAGRHSQDSRDLVRAEVDRVINVMERVPRAGSEPARGRSTTPGLPDDPAELEKLTVAELQVNAKALGLKHTHSNKAELIARIASSGAYKGKSPEIEDEEGEPATPASRIPLPPAHPTLRPAGTRQLRDASPPAPTVLSDILNSSGHLTPVGGRVVREIEQPAGETMLYNIIKSKANERRPRMDDDIEPDDAPEWADEASQPGASSRPSTNTGYGEVFDAILAEMPDEEVERAGAAIVRRLLRRSYRR